MKNIKYIAGTGVLMLMSAFSFVSCTDGNDWDVDKSYDRVFSVQEDKISVSEDATTAEVSWTTVTGATSYIIEISTDSLYNDIEMGGSNAVVYGSDNSIVESPYVITGLKADTKYFLRMKAVADGKQDSRWSYLDDYSFTTKTEQIFESLSGNDLKAESVTLRWEAGADVERIDITDANGAVVVSYNLSADEKTAGTATISGLTSLTSYTATLYLGEIKRGVLEFTTTAQVPDADFTYNLAASDSLNNAVLEDLLAQGYQTVNVTLAAGAKYYNEETLDIPDGMSVTFFGMPGDKQAVVGVKNFNLEGTHAFVNFENIELTGEYGEYIINQDVEATVGTVKFSNCFIHDFKQCPVRMKESDAKVINELIFEKCTVYGSTSRTYSLVHVDAGSGKGTIQNVRFTQSTIVYTGKSFVYSKNTNFTSLVIEDCTLSKVIGSGDYLLDCNSDSYGPSEGVTIKNTILGSTSTEKAKGIRASGNVTVDNSYQTSDVYFTGNKFSGLTDYEGTEAQLFQDPANFDFTIIDNSFAGKDNCGDPRWYKK